LRTEFASTGARSISLDFTKGRGSLALQMRMHLAS
jgi:hypothetical protein